MVKVIAVVSVAENGEMEAPSRLEQLKAWLVGPVGLTDFTLEPASSDASFRRYFRLTFSDGTTRIAMDAPPEKEDCRPVVDMTERLQPLGLNVPTIHAVDLVQGFMLLKDLGVTHYLDCLDEASVDALYGDALSALQRVQGSAPTAGLARYDESLLRREMSLFSDWLLRQQLQFQPDGSQQKMLDRLFSELVNNALEQPRVCVLRDYHSRNLLVCPGENPGIIDYQDAVEGPLTYDLVSLLRDCYIRWPLERVEQWARDYYQAGVASGRIPEVGDARFMQWFDLMGVQRQLKASGIFARLNRRDGKPGYLKDIPRTLGYILDISEKYPELQGIGALLRDEIVPRLESSSGE